VRNNFLIKNFISVLIPSVLSLSIYFLSLHFKYLESKDAIFSILGLCIFCFGMNILYAYYNNKAEFTGLMLIGTITKLLLALFAVFLYSYIFPYYFKYFSFQLVVYYVLFTIFELKYLLNLISTKKR
jgi:hypothetical protein